MPKKNPDSKWLRWLTNLWTLLLFIIILEDFLLGGTLERLIAPAAAIYIGLLTLYSTQKEFERWYSYHDGKHPGELYVICWTVVVVSLLVASYFVHNKYQMNQEIFSTYIVVLGILAITKKSKSVFQKRRRHHRS